MSRKLILIFTLFLAGCDRASTSSGSMEVEILPSQREQICSSLLKQCKFNDSDDCIQLKQKQSPEQALIDQNRFSAFRCDLFDYSHMD